MKYSQINHAKAWGFSRRSPNLNLSVEEDRKDLRGLTLYEKTLTKELASQNYGDAIWLRTNINILIQSNTNLMSKLLLCVKDFIANTISTITSSGFRNTERSCLMERWQKC